MMCPSEGRHECLGLAPCAGVRRHRRVVRPRAFTLLELVMVAMIMGILAMITVPRMGNAYARHRADAAVHRVTTDLQFARRYAASTSASLTVRFNTTTDTLRLMGVTGPNRYSGAYIISLADDPYGADLLSANFGGDADVIFDGFGRADSGGGVSLSVGGEGRVLTLDADTGGITVAESVSGQVVLP